MSYWSLLVTVPPPDIEVYSLEGWGDSGRFLGELPSSVCFDSKVYFFRSSFMDR